MKNSNNEAFNLSEVISQFNIAGSIASIQSHGSGHIHDTFQLVNTQKEHPDYLLQRINHHIFKNVPLLMDNIRLVTKHLRMKLADIPGGDPEKEVLTLVSTRFSQCYYQDTAGNYWRMYYFLKNTITYDIVQTQQQAYEGGKAFGRFQALLSDLEVNQLHETIPNFHNIQSRLQLFRAAVQKDRVNRVKEVSAEIAFLENRAEAMGAILRLGESGALPLRITHNDTKFNNVLLNSQNKAQCVIDLDTVMPGYVAYDFGDAIRTTVNAAAEDEKDLEKVSVNMDLFESFTKGFLDETRLLLSETEIASLAQGVLLLPYIMGLRFLTDYIDGDNYYKIHFPEHNLQRSRTQLQLVRKLEEVYPQLDRIILAYSNTRPELASVGKS